MKFVFLLIAFFGFQTQVFCQWGLLRTMGIGGGIHFGYSNPQVKDFNIELKKFDLPEIEKGIYTFGGNFLISLGGIRAGLYGFGGNNSVEGKRSYGGNIFTSKVKMEESFLFGFIGYEVFNSKIFLICVDLGIGGGDYTFYITDISSKTISWNDALQMPVSFSNITKKLEYNIFSLQPVLTFEYIHKNFFKLFLSGGYNFILNGSWIKDDEFEISDAPKINLNGFSIRSGISIGIFF